MFATTPPAAQLFVESQECELSHAVVQTDGSCGKRNVYNILEESDSLNDIFICLEYLRDHPQLKPNALTEAEHFDEFLWIISLAPQF